MNRRGSRLLQPMALALARARSALSRADISIFHEFVPPPYGGGNQFLWGLRRELVSRGWRIENNIIAPTSKACLYNSFNFDFERLRALRRDGCRMVHRVDGPIAAYRGIDEGLDQRIWQINRDLADATVFQSAYSLAKHEEMGLRFRAPSVVHNAADPRIFHTHGRVPYLSGPRVRLIATSWSDHVNKGAEIYEWLDAHLDVSRYDLTFLGRTRSRFTRIRTLPPAPSESVADVLRTHDLFIIASRNEPCSNALIEAMSCGLPVAYLESGSHGELVGEAGLPFRSAQEIPAVLDQLVSGHAGFVSKLAPPRLSMVTDRYLAVMGLPPSSVMS